MRPDFSQIILIFILSSSVAQAEFRVDSSVSATAARDWVTRRMNATKTVHCASLSDISGAMLCSFPPFRMAKFLARASVFAEGLGVVLAEGIIIRKGQVLSHDALGLRRYERMMSGFDLKGSDLVKFYSAVNKECTLKKKDPNVCLSSEEQEIFTSLIIPNVKRNPSFVLLAVRTPGVVDHEIRHARYFLNPEYRRVVHVLWNEIASEQRDAIKKRLGRIYDTNDEDLAINEFQATYLAGNSKVGVKLREALISKGLIQNTAPMVSDPFLSKGSIATW